MLFVTFSAKRCSVESAQNTFFTFLEFLMGVALEPTLFFCKKRDKNAYKDT
jgi:hypothetical protein